MALRPPASLAPFWLTLLLTAFVVTLPIPHNTLPRNLMFVVLLAASAWSVLQQRRWPSLPLLLPWTLYAAVAGVTLIWAIDPAYSLNEFRLEIGYALLALLFGTLWGNNLDKLALLVRGLALGNAAIVGCTLLVAARLAVSEGLPRLLVGVAPLDMGVGKLSTFIVTSLPFAWCYWRTLARGRWRWLAASVLLGNVLALLLSMNRMGAIILPLEILALLVFEHRHRDATPPARPSRQHSRLRTTLAVLALAALAGLMAASLTFKNQGFINATQTDPRYLIWQESWKLIAEKPLAGGGIGINTFARRLPDWYERLGHGPHWHAHNVVLNRGVQMGWPGMLAFIFLWAAAARLLWPSRRDHPALRPFLAAATVMLGATILKNMTDDFFTRDTVWLFWLLVGALAATRRSLSSAAPSPSGIELPAGNR